MRIVRWGAAAGAVLLVSLPIAAQAEVSPSPSAKINTSSVAARTSTARSGANSSALNQSVSNVRSSGSVSHAAPSASSVRGGTRSNWTSRLRSTVTGHSVNRSSGVRTSSTRGASVTRASTVHSASTQTVIVPAPASSAEAYAANILGAIAISHTKASAGSGATSGTANVLELGGNPPASAFGGTQKGVGTSSGNLFDSTQLMIPTNALHLQLAPWSVTNSQAADGSSSSSNAIADLLVLTLGDTQGNPSQSATVKVLQSTSNANWTAGQSTSNATSDGAFVNVGGSGGLTIDLLHSDTSSTAPGSSYLISINGNQIPPAGSVGSSCALTIPGLLSLSCLTATGGLAGSLTTGASQVLGVTLAPGTANLPVNLINSNAASGTGGSISLPGVGSGSGGQTGNTGAGAGAGTGAHHAATASAAVHAGRHALPFTGLDVPMLLGIAVLLLTGGLGLVWWVRKPRSATVA